MDSTVIGVVAIAIGVFLIGRGVLGKPFHSEDGQGPPLPKRGGMIMQFIIGFFIICWGILVLTGRMKLGAQ
jgi:hypothetical protein